MNGTRACESVGLRAQSERVASSHCDCDADDVLCMCDVSLLA